MGGCCQKDSKCSQYTVPLFFKSICSQIFSQVCEMVFTHLENCCSQQQTTTESLQPVGIFCVCEHAVSLFSMWLSVSLYPVYDSWAINRPRLSSCSPSHPYSPLCQQGEQVHGTCVPELKRINEIYAPSLSKCRFSWHSNDPFNNTMKLMADQRDVHFTERGFQRNSVLLKQSVKLI